MRIAFRADASVAIGTGHVVRCAALARRLVDAGHEVSFLCAELPGDLIGWLEGEGFAVSRLPPLPGEAAAEETDARACRELIGDGRRDWLVVDHYQLGRTWEAAMADAADRILAIDDLGRAHACDVLLDQNYASPAHALYPGRVPARCELLLGPHFALLRPEFAALRPCSLRRSWHGIARLLVFMSGGDATNETGKALAGIERAQLSREMMVDVVIGAGIPHRRAVEAACARIGNAVLHVQTARMAELMAEADCAIGGSGSAAWERCALGLPALVAILAENQAPIAEALHRAGAHRLLGWHHELTADDYAAALQALDPASLAEMSAAAAVICDGGGVARVAQHLTCWTICGVTCN